MNKTGIFSIVTFIVAFIFIGIGMFGMNRLMEYREKQILSEEGYFENEEPARTWLEMLETSVNAKKRGMKETEESVDAFNNNNVEVEINPDESYIDESDAIDTAKLWIDAMDLSRYFDKGGWLGECSTSLVTKISDGEEEQNVNSADPYYSFWLVEFVNSVSDIKLYVNAESNSVWNARIILLDTNINSDADIQEYLELVGTNMLDDFAEYTGVVMLEQESDYYKKMGIDTGTGNVSETVIESNGGYAVTRIGYDSDIYAMMEIGVVSGENNHIMVSYSLQL